MKRAQTILLTAWLVLAGSGCGDDQDFVIRPSSTESLSLSQSTYDHGLSLSPHAVASSTALGTMLASDTGLYQLNTAGITLIEESPIVGLASYGEAFIYATGSSISIWDGFMVDSGLNDFFTDPQFTGLAVFGQDIWIATAQSVFLHQSSAMIEFPDLSNVSHFSSFSSSNQLVLSGSDGSTYLIEHSNGDYYGQSLADEPISKALIGTQNSILAHDNGALMQRLPGTTEDTVSWHPVALTTNEEDPGEQGVLQMLSDPQTGATWLRTESELKRLQQDRVYTMELPSEGAMLIGVADDASVWLSDNTAIYKLEGDNEPVTFAENISAFDETNCAECHAPGGPAHEIHTYEQWVAEIDEIIEAIESGTMPAGGNKLEGATVQLLYQWMEDGLRP
ncbi:MAG: hypothetical protein HOI23_21865 [Deltaproteobacteria bacterium]|jgi:hypothetical protein|nr:hypothetical protein [Deltaproteobacteria bacterium]MBT6434978.1 hypothetical protein [Deltaproteobacteria bacterium]MBT6489109.1 hypothetical protein [Deltaproteobacteria bacterium]